MLEALKSLDSFPKALDDFRVKTYSGAIGMLSILSSFIPKYACNTVKHSFNIIDIIYDPSFLFRNAIFLQNGMIHDNCIS